MPLFPHYPSFIFPHYPSSSLRFPHNHSLLSLIIPQYPSLSLIFPHNHSLSLMIPQYPSLSLIYPHYPSLFLIIPHYFFPHYPSFSLIIPHYPSSETKQYFRVPHLGLTGPIIQKYIYVCIVYIRIYIAHSMVAIVLNILYSKICFVFSK